MTNPKPKLKNLLKSSLFPEDVDELARLNNLVILDSMSKSSSYGGLLVGDILELLEKLTGKIFLAHQGDFVAFFSIEDAISSCIELGYIGDNMITFLKDYWVLCQEKHQPPRGVILAFAPFGRKDTLEFMQCLGVEISAGTANRVVSRETTEKAIEESYTL